MIPGEYFIDDGEIELNEGRNTLVLRVANSGDRPIQVGSHYHFSGTNAALNLEREKSRGYRLNIAAGTAVRFEPGQERAVSSWWNTPVRKPCMALMHRLWVGFKLTYSE